MLRGGRTKGWDQEKPYLAVPVTHSCQRCWRAGSPGAGTSDTGWLNRALVVLASEGRADPRGGRAIGVGPVTPLVVRGRAPVMSWAPQQLLPASDDTQARLLDLYRHSDEKLAAGSRRASASPHWGVQGASSMRRPMPRSGHRASPACAPSSPEAAGTAARYLARPDGPRVGGMSFDGWDTHINEGAAMGQLANLLGALDGALAAIETNMGDAWRESVVFPDSAAVAPMAGLVG